MQLAGSGNGTPPCHRPITEHAGRVRRQLPSNGNRRAERGKAWGEEREEEEGGGSGCAGSSGSVEGKGGGTTTSTRA